jgi:hypothetical protein
VPRGGELVDVFVLAGSVLLPGDPRSQAELAGYNAAVRQAPLAAVGVTSVADLRHPWRNGTDGDEMPELKTT